MAKTARETIFLVSSGASGTSYAFRKNKRKVKGEKKLALKKYDPRLRKHVLFEEKKVSALKARFNAEKGAQLAEAAAQAAASAPKKGAPAPKKPKAEKTPASA